LQEGLAILQGLVFELCQGLDDLGFQMEILDGKATLFLQMLSALQGACHPTNGEANAAGDEPLIPVSAAHRTTKEKGTLVEEEATPVANPTTNATSLDAWPHYQPTT
jgi:hypothetical protein